ncbi:MAG TPA: hypothetical protein VL283_03325 [Candidatus Baltobacteraceae bacterium]|nr:hypothetical protein [Candidatus Baltobacteraceae bacterium]
MQRLRRNEVIHAHQAEFSPVLFDILFGLLIFLGIASFDGMQDAAHFVFFLASIAVVLHWWLKRKAAETAFGLEASNSTLDLLFGIGEVALLQMAMLGAARADYAQDITYFTLPLLLESARALLWRFFGKWHASSAKRVRYLEQQLGYVIFLNLAAGFVFGSIVALSPLMYASDLVLCFVIGYGIYIALTQQYEIIDVKLM